MGKKSSLLSHRGRSEAQVYDIRACYGVLFTEYTGDRYLFLDIQFSALLSDKEEMIGAEVRPTVLK